MKKPLVSIITVVYNGAKTIEQTINSVIHQTYTNIEYIIIDGNSTDATLNVVNKYLSDVNFVVSEPDKGLYDAMNKGIKLANGELIGMINSDDWYELDAVETMVNAYRLNPAKTIFHADRFDIDEEGNKSIKKFNPSAFKFKYYGMTYSHPSMFITKSEYHHHLYNYALKSHSDYQFVLEAFLRDKETFCYIDKPIVNYRLGGISAKINMWKASKQVFKARTNAGLPFYKAIFAFLLMRIVKTRALFLKTPKT